MLRPQYLYNNFTPNPMRQVATDYNLTTSLTSLFYSLVTACYVGIFSKMLGMYIIVLLTNFKFMLAFGVTHFARQKGPRMRVKSFEMGSGGRSGYWKTLLYLYLKNLKIIL